MLEKKQRKDILFCLSTFGGSPDEAFRIAKCIQHHYQKGKFRLFVSSRCKSAGTLLALGADEIIMSPEAELGPLDVQILKPDEFGERTSGLALSQALSVMRAEAFSIFEDFFIGIRNSSGLQVSTRAALEIAAKVATGCLSPVYQQIDPTRMGENERAVLIAMKYGDRLSRGNLKDGAVECLISGYPSHGFVIDRGEAGTLFNNVQPSDDDLELLVSLVESSLAVRDRDFQLKVGMVPLDCVDEEALERRAKGNGNGNGQVIKGSDQGKPATPERNGEKAPRKHGSPEQKPSTSRRPASDAVPPNPVQQPGAGSVPPSGRVRRASKPKSSL
ncbi:MAG: hypothetical protein P4L85_19645 [Paludisphaera borealis]|nr:hypothetical protein [Paludisphaera borealis]